MPRITLYHGTAHDFDAFDESFMHRGSQSNSALGIHLTESPALAAEYAQLATHDPGAGRPRVLTVVVHASKVAVVSSRDEFFGLVVPDEAARDRDDFEDARHRLMDQGFEAVACEYLGDDLIGAWVVLDPNSLQIVDELSLNEAECLDDTELPGGIEYSGVRLFETVPVPML